MANNTAQWESIIRKIAPTARQSIINGLAAAMPEVIEIANLSTKGRQAQFLAQIAHESDGFRTTVEYASGREYDNRSDLGNGPNDGPIYKGRGLIQITGKNNYRKYGNELNVDFIRNPELASQFPYAALTAALFWRDNNLNKLADINDIDGITRKVNGGYNGLESRRRYLKLANYQLNDVRLAQSRLTQLNYPVGGIDGIHGPLTRSGIRDFQDAANLPITGSLDPETIRVLHSNDAPIRPVSDERANITASELRDSGSNTIKGTDEARIGAIGGGLATAAGITTQASTIISNVQDIAASAQSGIDFWSFIKFYWPALFGIIATIVACYFAWKCYKGAKLAEQSRVRDAAVGINVAR